MIPTGSSLETDLLRVKNDHASIQQLTDVVLSSASSNATRREALVQLGNIYFYGNNTLATTVNGTLAMNFYAEAASMGDSHAQFHLGIACSYGFWGFPKDDAAAVTQYYFAALGKDTGAVMALGYKHLMGIDAPKNCETAVRYYEVAANKAIELREANQTQPAIYDLPHRRLKTVAETQHKKNVPTDAAIVDYYQFSADKGDAEATMNLATLYYYGARGLQQDLTKAAALFLKAYELGANGGAYHLGHIYNHGIGVPQENDTAFKYLNEAMQEGNTAAQNELAYMYLEGKGTERNPEHAVELFKTAAKQGSMEAFYNLGVLHMQGQVGVSNAVGIQEPEYEVAHGYFQVAAHQGHTVSSHKLAHMSLHGIGTSRSCKNAVDSFKLVAERGEWDRMLSRAFKDFKNQDYEAAFVKYAVMAQQGYEIAQHNAAYLLDHDFLTPSLSSSTATESAAASMMLYKFAALQGNVDANLKIGDYYYYGKGGHQVDFTKASAHYSLASKRSNAQAMFNLALMYEHGIGVEQDFFLAKRFFDRALDAHSDAHVPVTLALWKWKMHLMFTTWKRWWDEFMGYVEPTVRPTAPSTPASTPVVEDASSVASLFESWWPSSFSLASVADKTGFVGNWYDLVYSDNFVILLLSMALGLVLYIRVERQHFAERAPQPNAAAP